MLEFLQNKQPEVIQPDATVATAPKKSMRDQIHEYATVHPSSKAPEIAAALGVSAPYVYTTLSAKKRQQKKPLQKKPAKSLETLASKNKVDGFAIGVTQPHYWVISALASGKKVSRSAILRDIIDQYIRDVLTEANQNGSSI